jgi:hypothetical protein
MKRTINNLGNDNDYAMGNSTLVYSKRSKRKIRKAVKRMTSKHERREVTYD